MESSYGHVSQGPNVDYDLLQHKVHHLENTLKTFQSEVVLKMSMVEQILAMKNEQLVLQKEFHDREHTLYEDILSKWNTVVNRTSSGRMSTPYSKATPGVHDDNSFSLGKRSSSTSVSYHLRKRLVAKRCRINGDDTVRMEAESSNDNDQPENSCDENEKDPVWDDSVGLNSDADTDDQDQTGDGDYEETEKKIFREVFSTKEPASEANSDHFWDHFLQEENGTKLMCKHCHDKGFQKIYKITGLGRTVVARTHLKRKHKIYIDPPPPVESDGDEKQAADAALEKGARCRKTQTLLRHKNYLYKRNCKRNSIAYWCCREAGTCNGRIIIPRGGIIRESTGHSCLTTPADCDAYMLREKIKDLSDEHPMLSANDIITSVKEGQSEEVLQLLPPDEALRRIIQRRRKSRLTSPPT